MGGMKSWNAPVHRPPVHRLPAAQEVQAGVGPKPLLDAGQIHISSPHVPVESAYHGFGTYQCTSRRRRWSRCWQGRPCTCRRCRGSSPEADTCQGRTLPAQSGVPVEAIASASVSERVSCTNRANYVHRRVDDSRQFFLSSPSAPHTSEQPQRGPAASKVPTAHTLHHPERVSGIVCF